MSALMFQSRKKCYVRIFIYSCLFLILLVGCQHTMSIKNCQDGAHVRCEWLHTKMTAAELKTYNLDFKSKIQEGDELWRFSSPQESWEHLAGRAGICIVRDGEITDSLVTIMN